MAAVAKDPAIKLFGRTIFLHDNSQSLENDSSMITTAEHCRNENSRTMEEPPSLQPCKIEQPQTSAQQSVSSPENSDSKAHHDESDDSGEPKSHKRPDKILPCPRCKSADTKFCYFNNYNVNQPRHFCKSCQRYWTAGGTVRNVPVGAGRRRNKHLASQYRQLVASSDVRPTTVIETSDPRNRFLSSEESASSCTTSSPNEMVLKFGPESPHCHSAPNLLSQSPRNGCSDINLHNYSLHEQGVRAVNSDVSLQQPLYNGSRQVSGMTPYTNGCGPFPRNECNAQQTSNVSVQFVPASYWNYIPVWVAGSGNVSSAVSNGCVSLPFFNSSGGVQVLGKHSRDTSEGEIAGEGISSTKTRRIHDVDES